MVSFVVLSFITFYLARTIALNSYNNGQVRYKKLTISSRLSSFHLHESNDETDYELEPSQSPLDQFLTAFKESFEDETILKLTLLENESLNTFESEEVSQERSAHLAEIIGTDYQRVKEWAAVSGRLIRTKSETKLQLICYKDKSMKSSDLTKNYSSCEEAVSVVSAYITGAFKKGTLSTKDNDFEIKMKRGQGKFRATSKVSCNIFYFCHYSRLIKHIFVMKKDIHF